MANEIGTVAIIGGGTMGSGIGSCIAQKGRRAIVKEINDECARACERRVFGQIDRAVKTNTISASTAEEVRKNFSVTSLYDHIRGADMVIEAVIENLEEKEKIYREISPLFPKNVPFSTNSSSLSIDKMALATDRPDRFMGTHFFNPAPVTALVELVRGRQTSDETYETAKRFMEVVLGKDTIPVKGCPGYLVNRILMPNPNEAALILTETKLTIRQIDARSRKFGWPMGPFQLLDYVGIDIAASVSNVLYTAYGERAKPAPILGRILELGRLGKKTGAGFYVAPDVKGFEDFQNIIDREYPDRREFDIEKAFERIMLGLYNEALLCLEEEIASPQNIDKGAVLGIMFPMAFEGPLHYIQEKYGFANLLADLNRLYGEYGERYKPAAILEKLVSENGKIFEKAEEEEW